MKKKLIIVLSSVFMAFILAATPVLADVSGQMDSRWEPDPLQPGAQWWRDTTNQNDIAQYYNDIYPWDPWYPHVEIVADGVYVVRGVGLSNVIALIGDTEWVLIDSMDSPVHMQVALLLLRPYVGTKRLKALIYTSEDYTHYSGSSVVAPLFSIPVYASSEFFTALAARSASPEFFIYNLRINGVYLTVGPDGLIGPTNTVGKFPFQYPNQQISAETTINLAGFNIDLIPAESANDADMLVWLPDQHVLFCGDAWSPAFPNIGPLTGNGRSVPEWVSTLNTMMSLHPDVMVPTHGPVISSNAEINTILTNYCDAMQYVYDSTQTLISQGVSEDDAAAQVQLPESWASDPYLQPFVSSIASAVRGIYHPDDLWFSSEPPYYYGELPDLASTLTTTRRAAIMAELGSDINHMLQTSLNAELAANDLASAEGALLMAWATYKAAPDNILASRICAQALRKNAFMQRSNQIRNYYLSVALEVKGRMPADTTPPSVAITAPVNGASYQSINVPSPAYIVSDDSDPYPSITTLGWSNAEGTHTMTVTATDFAGNAGSAIVTYTVDTTAPVVTPPPDKTVEATGVLTPVAIGTATATDAVGVVSITSNAPSSGFPVGVTTVTWTATDAAGNKGTATQKVTVVVISTKVDIDPNTLNLKSQSDKNAITAYIELPSGYDVGQINVGTVKLIVNGVTIVAQTSPTSVGDYDGDKILDRMVKFNRQAVITALAGKTGDIVMTVTGQLTDGRAFTGSDTIKVTNPGK